MLPDRRALLGGLGGLAIGCAVAGLTGSLARAGTGSGAAETRRFTRFSQQGGDFSWTPRKLDPDECAPVAYDGFWHNLNACGYGAFYSIVGMMAEKYGAPYDQFPFSMLAVNEGGIIGWGTICGALYGAAAAFALFWNREECSPMVNELFRWYESAQLPVYDPGSAARAFVGPLPANAPGSVLCHVSVSKWCHGFNKKADSNELGERCARLTVDVSRKAIEILNAKIAQGKAYKGAFSVRFRPPLSSALPAMPRARSQTSRKARWTVPRATAAIRIWGINSGNIPDPPRADKKTIRHIMPDGFFVSVKTETKAILTSVSAWLAFRFQIGAEMVGAPGQSQDEKRGEQADGRAPERRGR